MSRNRNPVPIDADFQEITPIELAVEDAEASTPELDEAPVENTNKKQPEVLCGVVLTRCPVVSYNPFSKVLVYNRDGHLIQTNAIDYHGEGYVEVE